MEQRLFEIVYELIAKGQVTAPELAEKFEVSLRTIYRDIDHLSSAGIPVYTQQGQGGGIFLDKNFTLEKTLLSNEEQQQLLAALEGLTVLGNVDQQPLLTKLAGLFKKEQLNWLEIDFSDWSKRNQQSFETLQQAIINQQRVSFLYAGIEKSAAERLVEPLKLIFKHHDWYLYGFCRQSQGERLFKLLRIKNLQTLAEHFDRKTPGKVLQDNADFQLPKRVVTLQFDKKLRQRVTENFEKFTENAEGLLVEEAFPITEDFYRFILSFGASVKVLAPDDICKKLQQRITAMQNLYQT
ncbi:helix-turn-helix transcriptional regulator [Enterococcus sp. LJL120]